MGSEEEDWEPCGVFHKAKLVKYQNYNPPVMVLWRTNSQTGQLEKNKQSVLLLRINLWVDATVLYRVGFTKSKLSKQI